MRLTAALDKAKDYSDAITRSFPFPIGIILILIKFLFIPVTLFGQFGFPPSIIEQPKSQTVQEGQPVEFSAQVISPGGPYGMYMWYKGDQLLQITENDPVFIIPSVKASDTGDYHMEFSSIYGHAVSQKARLTVVPKLEITMQPQNQTVEAGSSVTFSVTAQGQGALRYQWIKGEEPITGADKASFTIVNVQAADEGFYRVRVSDSSGSVISIEVSLVVMVKMEFTLQPVSVSAIVGSSVTFLVKAAANGPLAYEWLWNGNPVPLEKGIKASTMNNKGDQYFWLTLPNAQPADAGAWSIRIQDGAKIANSSAATLTILPTEQKLKVTMTESGRWPSSAGGKSFAVRASATHAYVAQEDGLAVYNINNATKPLLAGGLSLPGYNVNSADLILPRMEAANQYIYMPRGDTFYVVDAQNPAQPSIAGSYPMAAARDVQVVGSRAYVADERLGLVILNVQNPSAIDPVGLQATPISRLKIVGGFAYAAFQKSFYVFDITQPSSIKRLNISNGEDMLESAVVDFEIAGSTAIVALSSGSMILDVTNPADIRIRKPYTAVSWPRAIQVGNNTAWFLGGWEGLTMHDISGADYIQITKFIYESTRLGGPNPFDFHVSNGFAYIAEEQGLQIVNLQNSAQPFHSGFFPSTMLNRFAVSNGRLYSASGSLFTLDISNPSMIQAIASTTSITLADRKMENIYDLQTGGNRAYAVTHDPVQLIVYDVTDPAAIRKIGAYDLPGKPYQWGGLEVEGDRAYVACSMWESEFDAVEILDVSKPEAIRPLGRYSTTKGGSTTMVVARGSILTLVSDQFMQTVNVADPARPALIWVNPLNEQIFEFRPNGALSYSAGINGVQIWDTTDPRVPLLIGRIFNEPEIFPSTLIRSGNLLFVGQNLTRNGTPIENFVEVFDIRSPRSPVSVARYSIEALAAWMEVYNQNLHVATEKGLVVLTAQEGSKPVITAHPQPLTVTQGGTATFSVVAIGAPPLSYQWSRNGETIAGQTSPTLSLRNVQASDAAEYRVSVRNTVGETLSLPARLVVNRVAELPSIIIHPRDMEVFAGEIVSFSVEAEGYPMPDFQWLRNNQPIPKATNSVLIFPGTESSQAAGYSVIVSNSVGKVTSRVAQMIVNDPTVPPPVIERMPADLVATSGREATLSVVAHGEGLLTYRWSREGDETFTATGSTLTFKNPQASNTGYYHVTVRNAGGSVVSRTVLVQVVDADASRNTYLTIKRNPNALVLHAPFAEGSYAIYKKDQLSSGLKGQIMAEGEISQAGEISMPLILTEKNTFYHAEINPRKGIAFETLSEEPEEEDVQVNAFFAWKNPRSDLSLGIQVDLSGMLIDADYQQLGFYGKADFKVVGVDGAVIPGVRFEPAVFEVENGVISGSATIVGQTELQLTISCRFTAVVPSPSAAAGQKFLGVPVATFPIRIVSGSTPKEIPPIEDGPWAHPLKQGATIISSFDWPHGKTPGHLHEGLDYRAPSGTEVFAIQTGQVIYTSLGGGKTIGIGMLHTNMQTSERFVSRYLHVKALPVAALGAIIEKGKPIGTTADNLPAPVKAHLHFEIRKLEAGVKVALGEAKPGVSLHPLSSALAFDFHPKLNSGPLNSIPPNLIASKLVSSHPGINHINLTTQVQSADVGPTPDKFLLFQVAEIKPDLGNNYNRMNASRIHMKRQGMAPVSFPVVDLTVPEIKQKITEYYPDQNFANKAFGFAKLSDKEIANPLLPSNLKNYYRYWLAFDTFVYRGLRDGPKSIDISLEGLGGQKSGIQLRYGAEIIAQRLVGYSADKTRVKYEGEVILYNGSPHPASCQQQDIIVVEGSDSVFLNEQTRTYWTGLKPDKIESDFLNDYGTTLTFQFEVLRSALAPCGSDNPNPPHIRAYTKTAPDIVHETMISGEGSGMQFGSQWLSVEAGEAVPIDLSRTGTPDEGVRVAAKDCSWTVRRLKPVPVGTPVALSTYSQGGAEFWAAPQLKIREEEGQMQLMGLTQGTYELTAQDRKGGSACMRVMVSKTIVSFGAQVGPEPEESSFTFMPLDSLPTPQVEGFAVIEGRVVNQEKEVSPVCGYINISIASLDPNVLSSDWSVEPAKLPLDQGSVRGKVKTRYSNPLIPAGKAELRFEVVSSSEVTPPPQMIITTPEKRAEFLMLWNYLGIKITQWERIESPYNVPISSFAFDLPEKEDFPLSFESEICANYANYLSFLPLNPEVEFHSGGQLVPLGTPLVVGSSKPTNASIQLKRKP